MFSLPVNLCKRQNNKTIWDKKSLKETSFNFSESFATIIKNVHCLVVSAKFMRFLHVLPCVGHSFKKFAMTNTKNMLLGCK